MSVCDDDDDGDNVEDDDDYGDDDDNVVTACLSIRQPRPVASPFKSSQPPGIQMMMVMTSKTRKMMRIEVTGDASVWSKECNGSNVLP